MAAIEPALMKGSGVKHRSRKASLIETLKLISVILGLIGMGWALYYAFRQDWDAASILLPAYGTGLLAYGAFVQATLAATVSEAGSRRTSRGSRILDSSGWAAVCLGSSLAAIPPIVVLVQSLSRA